MKFVKIPQYILPKYRHEINCLLQEQHERAIRDVLKIKLDDDTYLQVANLLVGMKNCPLGVLKWMADKPKTNPVSARVFAIRTRKE